MDLQIIIPRAPSAYEIRINSYYEVWKREKEAREPKFAIENIRFAHDPHWRERIFSIQAIGDVKAGNCGALAPTIVWKAVEYAFWTGATAPYLLRMIY